MSHFDQLYSESLNLVKQRDFDSASEKIALAVEAYSDDNNSRDINKEDLYILKGTIDLSKGELEKAKKDFEFALESNPSSAEACMGLGQIFFTSEMIEEAKTMFEWAIKNEPYNASARAGLAKINGKMGLPEEHIKLGNEQYQPDDQKDSESLLQEAHEYFMNDEYSKALELISDVEDKSGELNILKGNIYLTLDQDEDAKKSFLKALELDGDLSSGYNGMAEYFYKNRQLEDAKTMYSAALEKNRTDQFALLGLSKVNKELGLSPAHSLLRTLDESHLSGNLNDKLEQSYQLFQEGSFEESLIQLDFVQTEVEESELPNKTEVLSSIYNFKGFIHLSREELDEAKMYYEKSLEQNSDSSQACAGLGEILYLKGKDQDAKRMYEWAVKNNRNNKFAVNGLTRVNKLLNLAPDHNSLDLGVPHEISEEFTELISKGYEYFNLKNYSQALEILDQAEKYLDKDSLSVEGKKSYASIYNFRGFCRLAMGEIETAGENFEHALKVNPNSSQACAGLGEVFFLMDEDGASKTMFEWAVKYKPDNKFAVAGLAKVNKVLDLPHDDNLCLNCNNAEVSQKVGDLIEEGYNHYQNKNFKEAIDKIESAENLISENFPEEYNSDTLSSLKNFMGFNYLSLQKTAEAKECFEISLKRNPESSQACAGLGEVFYLSQQDGQSKSMYEWALKNNPENKYALAGLTKVNKNLGFDSNHNSLCA